MQRLKNVFTLRARHSGNCYYSPRAHVAIPVPHLICPRNDDHSTAYIRSSMASRSRVSRGVPVAGSNVSNRASESETCRVCAEVTAMSLAPSCC